MIVLRKMTNYKQLLLCVLSEIDIVLNDEVLNSG